MTIKLFSVAEYACRSLSISISNIRSYARQLFRVAVTVVTSVLLLLLLMIQGTCCALFLEGTVASIASWL
jgi:hypothetical protein